MRFEPNRLQRMMRGKSASMHQCINLVTFSDAAWSSSAAINKSRKVSQTTCLRLRRTSTCDLPLPPKKHKIEFGKWFSGPWLNLCFIVFPIQQEIKKCCKFSQLSYWCTQDRIGVAARWLFVVRLGGSRRTLHPPYITICESDIITDNIILHNAGSLEVGSITLTVSCHLNSTNTWVGEDTAHSVRASALLL